MCEKCQSCRIPPKHLARSRQTHTKRNRQNADNAACRIYATL